ALMSGLLGGAVALIAEKLGDPGPKYDGRRTLNPLAHLDLVAALHAVFFRCTWTKPTLVDAAQLRGGWPGRLAIVLGACAVLAGTSAAALLLRAAVAGTIKGNLGVAVGSLLLTYSDLAIATAVLNLLPLPPFLGSLLVPGLDGVLKARAKVRDRVYQVACGVVILVSLLRVSPVVVSAVVAWWRRLLGF